MIWDFVKSNSNNVEHSKISTEAGIVSKNKPLLADSNQELNKWTAMVFGECGQGKSTTLNAIVEIVSEKYYNNQAHGCKFKSMESLKSVTSCVQLGTVGHMNLIDTPGLNDPDARRTDKNIHIEMIKNLSM